MLYTLQIPVWYSPPLNLGGRHHVHHQSVIPSSNFNSSFSSSCRSARLHITSVTQSQLLRSSKNLPAMPKGAPKPTAVPMVSRLFPDLQYLSLARARTHERPVPESEPLGERVEGNVAARALRVVVGRAHLARGGVEATTGSSGREACDGTGEHLDLVLDMSLRSPDAGAYFGVRFVSALSGDWQCSARLNGCSRDVEVRGRCWLRSRPCLPEISGSNIENRHQAVLENDMYRTMIGYSHSLELQDQ